MGIPMKQGTEFAIVLIAFAAGVTAAWVAKDLGASFAVQLLSLAGVVFVTTWTEALIARAFRRTLRVR
jgi:hypothetical protein